MSDVRLASWAVAESPVTVEYSLVVIEEIRQEVAQGFQKLARGGVEVGGMLYGARDGRTVSILAIRTIECEHARGPAFLLSDADRDLLEEQIRRESEDPRLEGMICVGWFLSHTRSEIMLTDSDLEIYSAYFGAPWQVTLVVRPGRGGSMRGGFFVREHDGTVRSESSYLEFNLPDRLAGILDRPPRPDRGMPDRGMPDRGNVESGPPRGALPERGMNDRGSAEQIPAERAAESRLPLDRAEREPLPYVRGDGGAAAAPVRREMTRALQRTVPADEPPSPLFLPPAPTRAKWPWLVGWLIVVGVLVAVLARYVGVLTPHPAPILLSVAERDGQLQIEWNPSAKPVTSAARGSLAIVDGGDVHNVPLSTQDLARGNFTYQRNSADVEVHMTVSSASGEKLAEEASRFLGSAPVRVDPTQVQELERQRDQLQAEVQRLRAVNGAQAAHVLELERTLRIMQARLGLK